MIQRLVPPDRLEQPIDKELKCQMTSKVTIWSQFESDGFTPE